VVRSPRSFATPMILCDVDSSLGKFVSFIRFTSIQEFTYSLFLLLGKNLTSSDAVITLRLTLREYIHERIINRNLAFHVPSVSVRVVCTSFRHRVCAVLR